MSEIHENAAGYALLSLDVGERAQFEAHLASLRSSARRKLLSSPDCCAAVPADPGDPTARLRAKVLSAIRELPQLPAEDLAERLSTPATPNGRPSAGTPARPAGPRRALPDSWSRRRWIVARWRIWQLRRQRRRSRILSGLVAAMLIVAVGLGGVIYNLVQQREAAVVPGRLRAAAAPRRGRPGSRRADPAGRWPVHLHRLQEPEPCPLPGHEHARSGPGRHYQLWTATGTGSDNDPVLDNPVPNQRPWRQYFRGDVAQADLFVVSIEQDGTTPAAPTPGQIVAEAELPS